MKKKKRKQYLQQPCQGSWTNKPSVQIIKIMQMLQPAQRQKVCRETDSANKAASIPAKKAAK
jgi:hypothetical protein